MKRLLFCILLIVFFVGCKQRSHAQGNRAKSKGTDLVGTWRLIEFADLDSAGNWLHPLGKNPRGFVTYTRTNIFNINMSSEVPPEITQEQSKSKNILLDDFLWKYSFGYFGTYRVDFKTSVVTHEVKGGTIPWFIGTDQPRPFVLKGDTLIIGDNRTWKRVLVKAD
jgi:hypothetical protein